MGFKISLDVFIFFIFSLSFPFNLISRLPHYFYLKLIYFLYFIPLFIILDLVNVDSIFCLLITSLHCFSFYVWMFFVSRRMGTNFNLNAFDYKF
jgi:hypothetical protein